MAVTGSRGGDVGQEAGLAFVSFLKASGLPESLWDTLLDKISSGSIGADGHIEVTASVDLQPNEYVFILPISLAASRPDLEQRIREDKDFRTFCTESMQLPSARDASPADVLSQIWAWTDVSASQTDWERHFTVACYEDGPALSSQQLMLPKKSLVRELEEQGLSVPDLEQQLRSIGRSIVEAASAKIGSWPRSRAVYGLDVLLDARTGCAPQLLEVNFAPDFTSLLKFEPSVISDMMHACFSREEPSVKFWRLREAPTAPDFDRKPDGEPDEAYIEKFPGFQELEAID